MAQKGKKKGKHDKVGYNKRKMTTSDGDGRNSRPKNKRRRKNFKRYRGQGRG